MTYIGEIIGEPEVLDASLFMTQPWRTFLSWSWAAVVVTDGCQDLAWQGADELAQRASDRHHWLLGPKSRSGRARRSHAGQARPDSVSVRDRRRVEVLVGLLRAQLTRRAQVIVELPR